MAIQAEWQWKGLTLEEPPTSSRYPLCHVSSRRSLVVTAAAASREVRHDEDFSATGPIGSMGGSNP